MPMKAGIKTTEAASGVDAKRLLKWANMAEVIRAKKLVRQPPGDVRVVKRVAQAKTLKPAITH